MNVISLPIREAVVTDEVLATNLSELCGQLLVVAAREEGLRMIAEAELEDAEIAAVFLASSVASLRRRRLRGQHAFAWRVAAVLFAGCLLADLVARWLAS